MSTLSDLRVIIRNKAKTLATDTIMETLIAEEINNAVFKLAREKKIAELYVTNVAVSLTTANSGTPLVLPGDFLVEDRLTYVSGENPVIKKWELNNRGGPIPPAPIYGRPTSYLIRKAAGPVYFGLVVDPYDGIDQVDDSLFLDYYARPAILASGDSLPSVMWDTEIVDIVCGNLALRENKPQIAKMLFSQTRTFAAQATSSDQ